MNGIRSVISIGINLIILVAINGLLFLPSLKLTTLNHQKRYINKKIVMFGGLLPIAGYLGFNFMFWCGKILEDPNKDYLFESIVIERAMAFAMLIAFYIVKYLFFRKQNNNVKVVIKDIYPYYIDNSNDEEKYYISEKYKSVGGQLKVASFVLILVFSFIGAIFIFNNINYFPSTQSFIANYAYLLMVIMIPLIVYEIGLFLDGELAPDIAKNQVIKVKEDLFNEMLMEYRSLYRENLLLTFDKDEHIKSSDGNEHDDYIYSKIFTPIVEGENMIVETENLDSLNDIIPPLLNLIFGTNRKVLFITENDTESEATYDWLKRCNVITDNIKQVVQVYTEYKENDLNLVLSDDNVDICIGTVDLLLENKEITKKADTIFSINVDNIIVKSPIKLNILTRILAENVDKKVQYILFANEVNGLQQSMESAFYSENFSYQVVRQKYIRDFHTMFYAKEKGMLQNKILPAMASDSIGTELPLLITPPKYGFDNIYAFSEKEPYEDELIALHKTSPNLKTYYNNVSIDIEEKVKYLYNEHFAENKDNMIIAYDDTENNLILLLKNYIKYASSRVLVNIVSDKYILRDYMIDNIDFFIQNYDFLGKIVPFHKDGKKIQLFKLINELCLENFEEEYLINELNKLTDVKISYENNNTFNAENYVSNTLRSLVKEVFYVDVRMESYLYRELAFENAKQRKYVYRLSENVKYELPTTLFTEINFVTADQKLKKLNKIPLYEIYQNYAVGQYVVFDGKSYLISSIDADEGIINLIYNDRINNMTYMHKKDVTLYNIVVEKSENVYDRKDLQYEKVFLTVDANVKYSGYYKFSKGLNFKQGLYEYQKNDYGKVPCNNYKSHKAMLIKFTTDKIKKMSEKNRLKIAETIAFLFNETFKTIYCNSNQYIILRAVGSKQFTTDNEVNDLYSPVVIKDFENAVGLFVMEDTELEKGILDSFTLKLDTTIIPLITDYLNWLLDETNTEDKNYQIKTMYELQDNKTLKDINDIYIKSFHNEKLCFFENDRLDFLKLGKEDVNEFFDLENAKNILSDITASGGNSITNTRRSFIQRRQLVDNAHKVVKEEEAVKDSSVDDIKDSNTTENITNENSVNVDNSTEVNGDTENKDMNESKNANEEQNANNDQNLNDTNSIDEDTKKD